MTKKPETYRKILEYLKYKRMTFVFIQTGELITRGDCRLALGIELNKKDHE